MRAIPNGRPNRKPYIIAVVLVVIVLVVLSAFFYLLIGTDPPNPCAKTPLKINYLNKTGNRVTLLVVLTPEGASTEGADISYGQNGMPVLVNATLYDLDGKAIANYSSNSGPFDNAVLLTKGMKLVITPTNISVSAGDVITISSSIGTFGTTTVAVP